MIAEMAELSLDDRVLEIGCGWGGFRNSRQLANAAAASTASPCRNNNSPTPRTIPARRIDDKANASFYGLSRLRRNLR